MTRLNATRAAAAPSFNFARGSPRASYYATCASFDVAALATRRNCSADRAQTGSLSGGRWRRQSLATVASLAAPPTSRPPSPSWDHRALRRHPIVRADVPSGGRFDDISTEVLPSGLLRLQKSRARHGGALFDEVLVRQRISRAGDDESDKVPPWGRLRAEAGALEDGRAGTRRGA